MISIVNVSETYKKGIQTYEVKVNQEIITTYTHDYNDGLAMCLLKAGAAVFAAHDHGEPPPPPIDPNTALLSIILDMGIKEIDLFSVRAANGLLSARVFTIRHLTKRTELELLRTHNFGRKSLKEVKGVLATLGLHLAG